MDGWHFGACAVVFVAGYLFGRVRGWRRRRGRLQVVIVSDEDPPTRNAE